MNNFIILGKHPVLELINSNSKRIIEVYVLRQNIKQLESIKFKNFKVVDKDFFKKIDKNIGLQHQGYAAKIINENFDIKKLIKSDNNIVLLDGINDPRNQGAIIRNCLAFNINDIVIEKKFYNQGSHSMHIASSGATMRCRIYSVSNINNLIKELKKNDYWIFGLDGNSKKSIKNFNFNPKKNVLIFGSEGYGMRKNIINKCDEILKIDINEKINSLNVSSASAVALYELNKKNRL